MSKPFSYSYSFTLTPTAPPKPELHEYKYNEFLLSLPLHWKQIPTAEDNTFNFHSAEEGADITISADFYDIPEAKAHALGDKNISSRLEALEKLAPGRVVILQRSIKPHSGGIGIELVFAAEVTGEHVYMFLGYVTARKILNFTLVCKPGKEAAATLFNETIQNFRPRLP